MNTVEKAPRKTSTKHFLRDFLILITVGIISYIIDIVMYHKNYKTCRDAPTQISLAMHHIFCIFVYVGWLSNNTYILYGLLFIVPLVMMHWITNNDQCVWSQHIRSKCNIDLPFQSLPRQLGLVSDTSKTFNRVLLLSVWAIVIYKLFIRK